MKKKNNMGFVLIETLIVTSFVAGVLIFCFIEFTSISVSYDLSFKYNTVEDLYALDDVREYILSDSTAMNFINDSIKDNNVINITDCSMFTSEDYCKKLFEFSNIDNIIVTYNYFNSDDISLNDENYKNFIKGIKGNGKQKYRLISSFKNSTYATIRFGETNE